MLKITEKIGFARLAAAPPAAFAFEFLQRTNDLTTGSSYTFNSQNFGGAAAGRRILGCAQTVHTAAAAFSCLGTTSIGGVTVDVHTGAEVSHQPGGSNAVGAHTCWFSAVVPTGGSGTVVVNYSESTFRCILSLYRAVGLVNSAPTDQKTDTADPGSFTLNIPVNGIAMAAYCSQTGTSAAWTGLANEDHDENPSSAGLYTGASESVPGGDGTRAVSCTITGVGGSRAMGGLTWA